MNRRVQSEEYSPNTANGWLSILRVVVNSYVEEFDLDKNPVSKVKNFKKAGYRTYTEEEPNSLLPAEVSVFLAKMRELFPQHYAMVALGFATGLRPSTLRPLRRKGPRTDVLWEQEVLLVRQSHTVKQEIMSGTKTEGYQRIALPSHRR